MVKVKVFIKNEGSLFDSNVFVVVVLPSVPRVGEILYLSTNHLKELAINICLMSEDVEEYKDWFFEFNDATKYNHKYVDIAAAYLVHEVGYDTSQDYALVSLTDQKIKDL